MPYLDIRLAVASFDDSARRQLATKASQLAQQVLGKRPEVTAVSIGILPLGSWMVGLQMQSDACLPAAYAELTITAGTNSTPEKAAFIAQMSDTLKQALPGLSVASYVVVREVDAQNWGYDGVTQDARRARNYPAPHRLPSGALHMAHYTNQAHLLRSQALASWVGESFGRLMKSWQRSVVQSGSASNIKLS